MKNKKEKILKDVGYEKKIEKPKEEEKPKSKISRHNPSVHKNSQFEGY